MTAYYPCGYFDWLICYLTVCADWHRFTFGQLTFKKLEWHRFLAVIVMDEWAWGGAKEQPLLGRCPWRIGFV